MHTVVGTSGAAASTVITKLHCAVHALVEHSCCVCAHAPLKFEHVRLHAPEPQLIVAAWQVSRALQLTAQAYASGHTKVALSHEFLAVQSTLHAKPAGQVMVLPAHSVPEQVMTHVLSGRHPPLHAPGHGPPGGATNAPHSLPPSVPASPALPA